MASSQWALSCSERLYQLLLLAYPAEFRRDYSQEMVQTFRDCCREELRLGGTKRVLPFWGTVFYDFIKSVSVEHVSRLKKQFFAEKEYSMLNSPFQLHVGQITDIGRRRAQNEDNMLAVLPEDTAVLSQKGSLFVVADGMGGHTRGERASEMAIQIIRDTYYQDSSTDDIPTSLGNAVKQANKLIYQANQDENATGENGMGTTCVAAVLKDDTIYLANAGDSLAYLINDQQVRQLAENHSWVVEQVRAGLLTEDQARTHENRNVITRALGTSPDVDVYLTSAQLHAGDTLVLCTDGLHTLVSEQEIRDIVEHYTPEESAKRLIARANENGGPDNITAIVVQPERIPA
jgi:protein phosphatase